MTHKVEYPPVTSLLSSETKELRLRVKGKPGIVRWGLFRWGANKLKNYIKIIPLFVGRFLHLNGISLIEIDESIIKTARTRAELQTIEQQR